MIYPYFRHFIQSSKSNCTFTNHVLSNERLMTSYRIKFDVAIIHANASIHDTKHLQVHLFVRDLWIQREGTILLLRDSLPRLSLP